MNHIPILIATSAIFLHPVMAGHPAKMDSRLAACPESVRKTIIAEARGGVVDELEMVQVEGKTIYIAEVELPGDLKIYVDENGSLIKVREEIKASEMPERVRQVVDVENGRIDDVEKQTSNGKVVYFVEIDKPGGVEVNLRISPDGKVMSRREELAG
jgi:uncharacterized membrane protein YkoI